MEQTAVPWDRARRAAAGDQAGAFNRRLLTQHLDELEQEAERKGGVQQVLAEHFGKVYKVSLPLLMVA